MESTKEPSEDILKQAILELREPVVFRHLLHNSAGKCSWEFLDWSLAELAQKLGDMQLPFRVGFNARTKEPQWEINCSTQSMTLKQFLDEVESSIDAKQWYYFDYKYMHEWLKDQPEILASFNWRRFGFDKPAADSTLWIGSKGAHTSCHQDTYGCNLVAQIHGRKQWLLFPPNCGSMLSPTRIPYEESTIYSRYNFFCPTKEDEEATLKLSEKPRMVILEPGEVLLVPAGWWHYVESMDHSVSVNIWLPLATDCRARLSEALVKLIVGRLAEGEIPITDDPPPTLHCLEMLVKACMVECSTELLAAESPPRKRSREMAWTATDMAKEYSNYVSLLPELDRHELQELLAVKRNRFPEIDSTFDTRKNVGPLDVDPDNSSFQRVMESIVNALCHPDVVGRATSLLLDKASTQLTE